MKKGIAFVVIVMLALNLCSCSGTRKYEKDYEVSLMMADSYASSDMSEYYSAMKYEFKSKDSIVFEYTCRVDPTSEDWFTMRYSAAVNGEIHEEDDILDKKTNERYKTITYTINAIPESGGDNESFKVTEYIYSGKGQTYVKITDTTNKTVWYTKNGEYTFDIVPDFYVYFTINK